MRVQFVMNNEYINLIEIKFDNFEIFFSKYVLVSMDYKNSFPMSANENILCSYKRKINTLRATHSEYNYVVFGVHT